MSVLVYLMGCFCTFFLLKIYNRKMRKDGVYSEVIELEQALVATILSWVAFAVLVFVLLIVSKTFSGMKNWFEN